MLYMFKPNSKILLVFDGYNDKPSTKDHEHMRRRNGKKVSPDFRTTQELVVPHNREGFLANENNKGVLTTMMSAGIVKHLTVHQTKYHGDTVFVKTAINIVTCGCPSSHRSQRH